jgi:hypothetical protein
VTKQTRQIRWLVGLLGVLAVVLTYQFWPTETATSGAAPSKSKDVAGTAVPMQVAEVDLGRLQAGNDAVKAAKRDPFRYKPKPPPPPPPPPPQIARPIVQQPPPPPPDPRPEIRLKYLGFAMSPTGVRIATLQDAGNNAILLGKQGDVIDGKYRLLRVDAGEVELSYLDGARRRRFVKGQ